GEIVSLLGRNGAGRSTAVKTIMGLVGPVGRISFRGERIDGLAPHQIARRGLGYVPEDREIFPSLTVRENLLLGVKGSHLPTLRAARFGADSRSGAALRAHLPTLRAPRFGADSRSGAALRAHASS